MTTRKAIDESFDRLAGTALKVKVERDELFEACIAAYRALYSYECGNSSPDLAKETVEYLEKIIKKVQGE